MTGFAEHRRVATVALVVASYDEAIAWYVERLGFLLIEDVDLGGGKRWVTVAPASGQGARLLLAEASDEAQSKSIGNQTGGRVFLFLETDDFARPRSDAGEGRRIPRSTALRALRHGGGFRRSVRQSLGSDRTETIGSRPAFPRQGKAA